MQGWPSLILLRPYVPGKAGQVTAVGIHDVYGTEYGDRISIGTGVILKE